MVNAATRTLIKGGFAITMDDDLGVLPVADIAIGTDGTILEIGEGLDVEAGDVVVDASKCILLPGFVDTHRHMYSGLARCTGDGLSYGDYFEKVVIGYGQSYTPQDTFVSVRLGLAEAIETGITTMHGWEHNLLTPAHADESLRALRDSGMRGRFSYGPSNVPMDLDLDAVTDFRARHFETREDGRAFTSDGLIELGIACRGVELGDAAIWGPELTWARGSRASRPRCT